MRKLIPTCFAEKINRIRAQLQKAGQKWSAKALQLHFLLTDKQAHCHGKHDHVASQQSLLMLPLQCASRFPFLRQTCYLAVQCLGYARTLYLGRLRRRSNANSLETGCLPCFSLNNSGVKSCHLGTRQRCWARTPTWRNCLTCWLYILSLGLGCYVWVKWFKFRTPSDIFYAQRKA